MPSQLEQFVATTRQAIVGLANRLKALESKESSIYSLGLNLTTFANRGTGKAGNVSMCTNCRKGAEGAGLGTGCLIYWNTATVTWKRVYDNADATA